jgi:hypothetical protein
MNTATQPECKCTACPGASCACGCQEQAARKACGCGPQCQCGPQCACAKADD